MAQRTKKKSRQPSAHDHAEQQRLATRAYLRRANHQERQIRALTQQLERAMVRADATLLEFAERIAARGLAVGREPDRQRAVGE